MGGPVEVSAGGRSRMTPKETLAAYPAHDGTLRGLLASRTAVDPCRPFLLFGDRVRTWGEFQERVERAAWMLVRRGLGRGDRIAVMAPNSDDFVLLFFAVARIGAVLVPVNPAFSAAEAGHVLGHAEVSAVVCSAAAFPAAAEASQWLPTPPWLVTLDGGPAPEKTDAGDAPRLEALLSEATRVPLPEAVGADEVCLILYTSGTTGLPKGVMHSQRSFVMTGEAFVERMNLQPDDRLLCVLPLFHINALFYSLGGATAAGASLVIAPRFSASAFWRLAARSGATEVNIIAAIGAILARRPRSEYAPGHSLRKLYGAPVSREIADTFRDEFDVPTVIEGYGTTEAPGVCNLPFAGPHRIGSMGRAARHPDPSLTFAELRVVDERGEERPDGEVGELTVRTPVVMKGYFKDPDATAAAFRDGWFLTGDLVRRDAEGYFWFVARRKDLIRSRGENISALEVERVIGSHPGVSEAAVIAVPSDLGEDDVLAAVVPRPGAALDAGALAEWCAARLSPIKVPRYVSILPALPQTPTHRVAKHKLREDPRLMEAAVDLRGERERAR